MQPISTMQLRNLSNRYSNKSIAYSNKSIAFFPLSLFRFIKYLSILINQKLLPEKNQDKCSILVKVIKDHVGHPLIIPVTVN